MSSKGSAKGAGVAGVAGVKDGRKAVASRAVTLRFSGDLEALGEEVAQVGERSGHSSTQLAVLGVKLLVAHVRRHGHVPMDPLTEQMKAG